MFWSPINHLWLSISSKVGREWGSCSRHHHIRSMHSVCDEIFKAKVIHLHRKIIFKKSINFVIQSLGLNVRFLHFLTSRQTGSQVHVLINVVLFMKRQVSAHQVIQQYTKTPDCSRTTQILSLTYPLRRAESPSAWVKEREKERRQERHKNGSDYVLFLLCTYLHILCRGCLWANLHSQSLSTSHPGCQYWSVDSLSWCLHEEPRSHSNDGQPELLDAWFVEPVVLTVDLYEVCKIHGDPCRGWAAPGPRCNNRPSRTTLSAPARSHSQMVWTPFSLMPPPKVHSVSLQAEIRTDMFRTGLGWILLNYSKQRLYNVEKVLI